jgi:hypothetical protein
LTQISSGGSPNGEERSRETINTGFHSTMNKNWFL